MAAYNFEEASLKLYFETSQDEFGNPILTPKTYRNVRDNVPVDNLAAVAQAIASLSKYPLSQVKRTTSDSIEF